MFYRMAVVLSQYLSLSPTSVSDCMLKKVSIGTFMCRRSAMFSTSFFTSWPKESHYCCLIYHQSQVHSLNSLLHLSKMKPPKTTSAQLNCKIAYTAELENPNIIVKSFLFRDSNTWLLGGVCIFIESKWTQNKVQIKLMIFLYCIRFLFYQSTSQK